ncbi:hypothetical protein OPT61_g9885 [Boeremia exigua]|uniref:Uncharacterized protein n=1 Tax=Boeremia exigua TaxID=749465 RepID=A0ACC2HT76_9PLEO|nr:hypothetical protein OPT61_g9885 [Boeremia exigua]
MEGYSVTSAPLPRKRERSPVPGPGLELTIITTFPPVQVRARWARRKPAVACLRPSWASRQALVRNRAIHQTLKSACFKVITDSQVLISNKSLLFAAENAGARRSLGEHGCGIDAGIVHATVDPQRPEWTRLSCRVPGWAPSEVTASFELTPATGQSLLIADRLDSGWPGSAIWRALAHSSRSRSRAALVTL